MKPSGRPRTDNQGDCNDFVSKRDLNTNIGRPNVSIYRPRMDIGLSHAKEHDPGTKNALELEAVYEYTLS